MKASAAGVNTLDVSCAELSGALIGRHLAVKRSSRLARL